VSLNIVATVLLSTKVYAMIVVVAVNPHAALAYITLPFSVGSAHATPPHLVTDSAPATEPTQRSHSTSSKDALFIANLQCQLRELQFRQHQQLQLQQCMVASRISYQQNCLERPSTFTGDNRYLSIVNSPLDHLEGCGITMVRVQCADLQV